MLLLLLPAAWLLAEALLAAVLQAALVESELLRWVFSHFHMV
jgi:hypothetical protein